MVGDMQNTFDFLWQMLDDYLVHLDLAAVPAAAWVGLALLVAVWLGERLYRLGASRTTGYWLCGAVIGSAIAAVAHPVISGAGKPALSSMAGIAQAMFNLALGWLLVELGQRMDWRWLWRNKALAVTALLEFALTWIVSAVVLHSLGFDLLPAGVMATLVAHSSPVVLASLLQPWRAQGQVTERTLHVGSINTVLTVLTLPLVLAWASAYTQGTQAGSGVAAHIGLRSGLELAQPLWEVVASVAWGYALGWLLSRLGAQRSALSAKPMVNPMVASFSSEWVYLAGAVCLAVGCAQWWDISALVACLALGLSLRTRAVHAHAQDSHAVSALAQILMFVVAGASLPWLAWAGLGAAGAQPALSAEVLVLAGLLLVIRLCVKTLACTLTAHWAGLRWVQGLALGLMLQPLSMTGLVLWGMVAGVLSGPLATLSLAYLLMLCVSDVLSPWAMQLVLRSMREVEPEPEPAPVSYSGLQTQSSVRQHHIDTDSLPAAAPATQRPMHAREVMVQPHTMRHPQPQ